MHRWRSSRWQSPCRHAATIPAMTTAVRRRPRRRRPRRPRRPRTLRRPRSSRTWPRPPRPSPAAAKGITIGYLSNLEAVPIVHVDLRGHPRAGRARRREPGVLRRQRRQRHRAELREDVQGSEVPGHLELPARHAGGPEHLRGRAGGRAGLRDRHPAAARARPRSWASTTPTAAQSPARCSASTSRTTSTASTTHGCRSSSRRSASPTRTAWAATAKGFAEVLRRGARPAPGRLRRLDRGRPHQDGRHPDRAAQRRAHHRDVDRRRGHRRRLRRRQRRRPRAISSTPPRSGMADDTMRCGLKNNPNWVVVDGDLPGAVRLGRHPLHDRRDQRRGGARRTCSCRWSP